MTSFLVFGEILMYFFANVFSASFKNTKAVIRNKLTEKEEKMEQPYHFTNLTLVGEDDELRLCDLKQNGNLYPHAVSCMGLAAGSFGLVSLQPQVQFCRRVVCKDRAFYVYPSLPLCASPIQAVHDEIQLGSGYYSFRSPSKGF